jgi:MFS transporter, FHS family, L-fucose permease
MGQLVFGAASFVSPLVFAAIMERESAAPLITLYGAFAAVFGLVIVVTRLMPLPSVELKDDERAGTRQLYWQLLSDRQVRLFFLGIVAYVGTEQGLANWMSQFLSTYHGLSPTVEGAHAVAMFWGLMSVGCLLGLLLLRLFDSRTVLGVFSAAALLCIALALFGPARVAAQAFPAAGFFLSVMFSIVFSLALNSVPRHHGAFSGILCTGILGGALVPLLVGVLGDWVGLRAALTVLFATVAYILSVSFWARPLIQNETVTLRRLRLAPERQPPS